MKVSNAVYNIIKILCKAIQDRRLLYFYYESESSGKKEWRKIRPYMILSNDKDRLELVGVPMEQLRKAKPQAGHYLLEKLDINQFEILDETFDDPGVPREIVDDTQTPVVCRFIYPDENKKEVMKSWIKVSKK